MSIINGPTLDMASADLDGDNNNQLRFVKKPDEVQFGDLYDSNAMPKMINQYPEHLDEYFSEPTDVLKEYLDGEEYDGSNLKTLVNKVEKKLANQINSGDVFGQLMKSSVVDIENALKIASKYEKNKHKKSQDEKIYELSKILIKSRQ
jgi:hypothetical protein